MFSFDLNTIHYSLMVMSLECALCDLCIISGGSTVRVHARIPPSAAGSGVVLFHLFKSGS